MAYSLITNLSNAQSYSCWLPRRSSNMDGAKGGIRLVVVVPTSVLANGFGSRQHGQSLAERMGIPG